ncbi:MAG: hypothetical protein R3360_03280, partial [Alphaproteobacteria bacterium]|nr:hypothetical protein [Alphaproteobacteria bacterium]
MRQAIIIIVSLVIVAAAVMAVRHLAGADKDPANPAPTQTASESPKPDAPKVDERPPKQEPAEEGMAPPTFDVVRVSREGTGVIAGRSEPEAFVEVFAGEESIGRVRANRDGEWVLIFEKPLPTGSQKLSLVATLEGEEPVESDNVVVVAVPERTDDSFGLEPDEGVVAVLSPRYGDGPSKILQTPGAFRDDADLRVDTLDYDESGQAIFTGFAAPGAEVRVYLDNWYLGKVKADEAGSWTFRPERKVSKGNHVLRVD